MLEPEFDTKEEDGKVQLFFHQTPRGFNGLTVGIFCVWIRNAWKSTGLQLFPQIKLPWRFKKETLFLLALFHPT